MPAPGELAAGVALDLYRGGVRLRGKLFSLAVGRAFAQFGPHSVVEPPVRVAGERRIAIGRDVYVGAGSWLQALDGTGDGVAVTVGDGTSMAGSCTLSAALAVRLGPKVLLARNVFVTDHLHAFEDAGRAVLDQGVDRIAPVEIGEGAWLGQNTVVGPGVRIGRGAVIGANAVVLDDVPDLAVAVGAPARVVRVLGGRARAA